MSTASSEGGTTPPGTREDLALIRERVPHYVEGSFVADSIEWGTHADDCPGCAIGEALARVADELERLGAKADSLAFELGGLEAMRVKDNAYLIGQRDDAERELARLRDELRRGAEHGETPEIRAWCRLALDGEGATQETA